MAEYEKQWATLYVVVTGPEGIGARSWVDMLQPALTNSYTATQVPSTHVEMPRVGSLFDDPPEGSVGDVADGPFRDAFAMVPGHFITAMKWNIRRADHDEVTRTSTTPALRAIRDTVLAPLRARGYWVKQTSLRPYGSAIAGDAGVPETPVLPRQIAKLEGTAPDRTGLWALLGLGAGALMLSRM